MNFKPMKNSTYDFLKWFALAALPAFNTFILTIGKIWDLPHYVQIAATVSAIGVLIAALIGVSTIAYNNDVDTEDEDYDEDQNMLMADALAEDEGDDEDGTASAE